MKTAKQWLTWWKKQSLDISNEDFITHIQADAYHSGLLKSVETCQNVASVQGLQTRAVVANRCANEIKAQMEKGEK